LGAKEFVKRWSEQGPSHHMAIGIGHVADKIEKIAKVLNIEYCKVC
jgi:L-arabinose isomerase